MNSRCQSTAASRTVNDYYVFPDSSMQPKGDVIDVVDMTSTPAAAPSPTAASPTAAAPGPTAASPTAAAPGSPSTPAPLPGPLPAPASPKPAPSPRTVPTPVLTATRRRRHAGLIMCGVASLAVGSCCRWTTLSFVVEFLPALAIWCQCWMSTRGPSSRSRSINVSPLVLWSCCCLLSFALAFASRDGPLDQSTTARD